MSSPLSSPYLSTSHSSTPRRETQSLHCVVIIDDIRAQVLNENEEVRFQCLAVDRDGRCKESSKNFRTAHARLFKKATEILREEGSVIDAERFSIVIRTFFCATHCKSPTFKRFSELIQLHWKGDGNVREKQLLEVIRQAHGPYTFHLTPTVDKPRSTFHSASTYFEKEAMAGVTDRCSQPLIQCTPPPTGITRSGEHAQSLPRPLSQSEFPPMVFRNHRHTSSGQSQQVRSRSNSSASNNSHHPLPSNDYLPHESSEANTLFKHSSSPFGSSISQSRTPIPMLGTTIPTSGPSTELPVQHLFTPIGPSRHMRHPINPSESSSFVDQLQESEVQPVRQPITNSLIPLESLNYCSPPSKSVFDFKCPTSQSQVVDPTTRTEIPNDLRLSLPISIFSSQATQRPVVNEQFKSPEPVISRPGVLPAPTNMPVPQGSTPEASRQVIPTAVSAPRLPISSSSYLLREFEDYHSWDKCFKPMGSREIQPTPTKTQRRQMSKDDTFLDQIASSVASVAPSYFQAGKQLNISVPIPRPIINESRHFCPSTIDVSIRDAIMNRVKREGHVYILKSPQYFQKYFPDEPPLLKIGIAADVPERMKNLREKCGLFDITLVDDFQDRRVTLHKKIEDIVHAELRNFRRVFKCKRCKSAKGTETEHQEWFAVEEEVALRTVQRWRRFIELEPYGKNGILREHWSMMIDPKNMKHPDAGEQWDDSESRERRWTKWLDEGSKGVQG